MEAATELPGGVRARGHVRARLAGRTRGEAVSDRPDRRCQQPAAGALCKTRLDGREPAGAAELPGAVGTAPSVLHGPGGIVPDESAGQPGRATGGGRGADADRGSVRVERRLDGTVAVRLRGRYLPLARCERKAETSPLARPRSEKLPGKPKRNGPAHRLWMEGFDLRNSPPLWALLQGEQARVREESS